MKEIDRKLMIFDGLPCAESTYGMSGANAMILRGNQRKNQKSGIPLKCKSQ